MLGFPHQDTVAARTMANTYNEDLVLFADFVTSRQIYFFIINLARFKMNIYKA